MLTSPGKTVSLLGALAPLMGEAVGSELLDSRMALGAEQRSTILLNLPSEAPVPLGEEKSSPLTSKTPEGSPVTLIWEVAVRFTASVRMTDPVLPTNCRMTLALAGAEAGHSAR